MASPHQTVQRPGRVQDHVTDGAWPVEREQLPQLDKMIMKYVDAPGLPEKTPYYGGDWMPKPTKYPVGNVPLVDREEF